MLRFQEIIYRYLYLCLKIKKQYPTYLARQSFQEINISKEVNIYYYFQESQHNTFSMYTPNHISNVTIATLIYMQHVFFLTQLLLLHCTYSFQETSVDSGSCMNTIPMCLFKERVFIFGFQENSQKTIIFIHEVCILFLKRNYIYVFIKHMISSRKLVMIIYVPRSTSLAISIMHAVHNYFQETWKLASITKHLSIYRK